MTCKLIEFCLLFFFALHFFTLWSFLELCFSLPQIFPTPSSTGASLVVQTVKNLPAMQETWVWSLGHEDPLEKGMSTHSSILPGEFQGHRSLVGYSPWGHKESDMTEQLFGASPMAQRAENLPAMQETQTTWVWSLGQKDPWRKQWQPTAVFLPGKFQGQRSLAGYSPRDHKESDVTKHMAHSTNHSFFSIFAVPTTCFNHNNEKLDINILGGSECSQFTLNP